MKSTGRTATLPALLCLALGGALAFAAPAAAEWQAIEKIETYPVSGATGAELYASIGEHGPKLGIARTIAHTSFRLTWKRDYQTRGTDCVLASAVPTLVITTVLPKPSGTLPEPLRRSWQTFVDGVAAHERVHGEHIKAMVKEIEKATIGLAEPDDPQCRRIREKMQPVLGEISRAERQKQRDFDKVEFADGGTVQRLVLALVNGP
ncbi:DUF922 domain-containing protein [Pseudomonas sp. R2.Fl]|nr:DUF922 domain-containing protein [Pseudomonas sp. R2.Fl]